MEDPHITNRLAQIGNICTQWSSLEYVLACAIWQLAEIRSPEVGKIVTAHLDLKQRVAMVFALAHATNAPFAFKKASKALRDAIQKQDVIHKRNQAVHGIQFPASTPGAVEIEMHRGKGGRSPRLQTDSELADLGNLIAALRNDFAAAVVAYIREKQGQKIEAMQGYKDLQAILRNTSATIEDSSTNGLG